jgi:uncharacterized protein affecting Mg2+/Co2+ transport
MADSNDIEVELKPNYRATAEPNQSLYLFSYTTT